ncbi:MAG: AtpZ/AtpI family protein [Halarcobacter sp.]
MENKNNITEPKHRAKLVALDNLSLGISMVAAVLIGFGIGYGLKVLTGYNWTLWLGLFWGIAAAGLNIYKAYKRAQKEFEGMENDPRYSHRAKYGDNSYDKEDDED